ncbi:MAG: hypothetical protein NWE98_02115 [Candidatus Bathyarchaeota archaeon]|nr:hypothetical protein [Candidatus Bathyarchaeota archaeon]
MNKNEVEQLLQQRQNLIGEFQTNMNIATKPFVDLAKTVSLYMQVTDLLIKNLQEENQKLESEVKKQ